MTVSTEKNHKAKGPARASHLIVRGYSSGLRILIDAKKPLLGLDYSDPETAVLGVAFHSFEWLFVRVAPIILVGAIAGVFLTRKKG